MMTPLPRFFWQSRFYRKEIYGSHFPYICNKGLKSQIASIEGSVMIHHQSELLVFGSNENNT